MEITLKLYASLGEYLPSDAQKHSTRLTVSNDETAFSILERFNVPQKSAHLVLLNGIYLEAEERRQPKLKDGDTLAIWPPIAGG